jgi:hypothetical protein
MSPESYQSTAGKSRHIYYASGDSGAALLQQMLGIFRAVTARLVELQLRPSLPTDVVVVRVNDLVEGLQLAIDRFLAEVETDPQRAGGQDLTPAQFSNASSADRSRSASASAGVTHRSKRAPQEQRAQRR